MRLATANIRTFPRAMARGSCNTAQHHLFWPLPLSLSSSECLRSCGVAQCGSSFRLSPLAYPHERYIRTDSRLSTSNCYTTPASVEHDVSQRFENSCQAHMARDPTAVEQCRGMHVWHPAQTDFSPMAASIRQRAVSRVTTSLSWHAIGKQDIFYFSTSSLGACWTILRTAFAQSPHPCASRGSRSVDRLISQSTLTGNA